MATDWAADVKKYDAKADETAIAGIVRYCGIALRNRDSALVSFSDKAETDRVRNNFLKKKLGLTQADSVLDAAIAKVGEQMKADRTKNRVTVYYLLAAELGQLGMFAKVAPAAKKAPAAKTAKAAAPAKTPAAKAPAKKAPAANTATTKSAPKTAAAKPAATKTAVTAPVKAAPVKAAPAKAGPVKAAPAAKAPARAATAPAKKAPAPAKKAAAPVKKSAAPAKLVNKPAAKVNAAVEAVKAAPAATMAAAAVTAAAVGAAATSAASMVKDAASGAGDKVAAAMPAASKSAPVAAAAPADDGSEMNWLWWVIGLAVVAFAAWWFFTSRNPEATEGNTTEAAASAAASEVGTDLAAAPAENTVPIPQGAGVTSEMRDGKPVVKVYFDSGMTGVAPDFANTAGGLKSWLDSHSGATLAVSGYSDPSGNAAVNAKLAKQRAQAVQSALVAAGIPATSAALVKPDAVIDATTAKDAARRVEVVVK